jgi:hypothetical protein
MQTTQIIAELDAEIARLQQAKALLNGATTKRSPGKPAASMIAAAPAATAAPKKRQMSAEGRARIAAAQKARWAKSRKAAK